MKCNFVRFVDRKEIFGYVPYIVDGSRAIKTNIQLNRSIRCTEMAFRLSRFSIFPFMCGFASHFVCITKAIALSLHMTDISSDSMLNCTKSVPFFMKPTEYWNCAFLLLSIPINLDLQYPSCIDSINLECPIVRNRNYATERNKATYNRHILTISCLISSVFFIFLPEKTIFIFFFWPVHVNCYE